MPETITKPVDEEIVDDLPPDEDVDTVEAEEDDVPQEDGDTAAEEVVEEAHSHPPELIAEATGALFSPAEISSMTPEALRTAIAVAHRVGQAVYNANKTAPAKEAPAPEPEDDLAAFDDPTKFDQEAAKPIKSALLKQRADAAKLADENRKLSERLEKLEKNTAASAQMQTHARLRGLASKIAPEAAKLFDVSTPAGQKTYNSLLKAMDLVVGADPSVAKDEAKVLRRAVRAFIDDAAVSAEPDSEKERKKNWDNGALGKPAPRKTEETDVEAVRRLLRGFRKGHKPTNGVS